MAHFLAARFPILLALNKVWPALSLQHFLRRTADTLPSPPPIGAVLPVRQNALWPKLLS